MELLLRFSHTHRQHTDTHFHLHYTKISGKMRFLGSKQVLCTNAYAQIHGKKFDVYLLSRSCFKNKICLAIMILNSLCDYSRIIIRDK